MLAELAAVIEDRRARPQGGSDAAAVILGGEREQAQRKVGEEAVEVLLAAPGSRELVAEVADLWFIRCCCWRATGSTRWRRSRSSGGAGRRRADRPRTAPCPPPCGPLISSIAQVRRLPAILLLLACLAAGCGDSGSSDQTAGAGGSSKLSAPAATKPAPGGHRHPARQAGVDSRRAGQAAPARRHRAVVRRVTWKQGAGTANATLGSKVHATATVTITNKGPEDAAISPTQLWLYDSRNVAHLAAAGGLIGRTVPAGGRVTGRVVFPMPAKRQAALLVYSFADAAAIAKATHVGLARYQ